MESNLDHHVYPNSATTTTSHKCLNYRSTHNSNWLKLNFHFRPQNTLLLLALSFSLQQQQQQQFTSNLTLMYIISFTNTNRQHELTPIVQFCGIQNRARVQFTCNDDDDDDDGDN